MNRFPNNTDYPNRPISWCYSPSSFTGKELDSETGYSYFGARYYDAELSGLFFSVDPMVDKYPNISPYAYCCWNPIIFVDPEGKEYGDFYGTRGQFLGNDGNADGRVYVIKNGENAPYGTKVLLISSLKIKLHSGNSEYFKEHPEIYDYFIAILPIELLKEAYNTILDDGTGGTCDANNREYGGYANDEGTAWEKTSIIGPVGNPKEQDFLPIPGLKPGRIRFHSHASGTMTDEDVGTINNVGGGMFNNYSVYTYSWVQTPSQADIKQAGIKPSYVFGMGDKTLSVYDKNGTMATIPLNGTSLGVRLGVK